MESVQGVDKATTNGTNGTKNTGAMPARKEVLFDGCFYDVTDFVKRHPGKFNIEFL